MATGWKAGSWADASTCGNRVVLYRNKAAIGTSTRTFTVKLPADINVRQFFVRLTTAIISGTLRARFNTDAQGTLQTFSVNGSLVDQDQLTTLTAPITRIAADDLLNISLFSLSGTVVVGGAGIEAGYYST